MTETPRSLYVFLLAAALLLTLPSAARAQGWRLVWGDEFEGARRARRG